ncbi:MAG: GFA family protein [Proteobacteria bacterium]|nr:GFA family protein [Pseudomonadota bacterium]
MSAHLTGGCQCGAVRFSCETLGRASICHCRMCQKAFGSAFGPLVTGKGLVWTKGEPKRFRSSNKVSRGFCAECGTPLTYEFDGYGVELAIGAFDRAADIAPVVQVNEQSQLPWFNRLNALPILSVEEKSARAPIFSEVVSRQHPDHES